MFCCASSVWCVVCGPLARAPAAPVQPIERASVLAVPLLRPRVSDVHRAIYVDKRAALDGYITSNATVPTATPEGEYLLRVEQIALHLAQKANGAQFYLSCSQVKITGGGSGTPGPLVALPGAYKTNDPGILVDLGKIAPGAYQPPGPAVWTG